jgi:predicted nucleic acid-binding protein
MSEPETTNLALIDACSVINLWASRHMEEILRALPHATAVVDIVAKEALHVRRRAGAAGEIELERIDLEILVPTGCISKMTFGSDEELKRFVEFAAEIDDGEAATCAIAVERGLSVITDDRKAQRLLRERFPQTRIITTSEVLKVWSDSGNLSDAAIGQVLRDIRDCARFIPRRQDPLHEWWTKLISEEG